MAMPFFAKKASHNDDLRARAERISFLVQERLDEKVTASKAAAQATIDALQSILAQHASITAEPPSQDEPIKRKA